MVINPLDLKIIRCLQANPRITNKSIGRAVGVTEQTVASRIRALSDGQMMRVMAQRDLPAAGYPVHAFSGVLAEGGAIERVAHRICAIDEAFSVVLCAGSPEIMVNLTAPSAAFVDELIARIGALPGVVDLDLTICEDIRIFRTGAGDLGSSIGPPLPLDRQDPVDEAIVSLLVQDGRLSNREIARRIGVSEGSVRVRLKRLADRRVMKLGVVCEPDRVGYAFNAYVFLRGESEAVAAVVDEMAGDDMIAFAATSRGTHEGVLFLTAADEAPIARLCVDRLRSVPGLRETIYRPLHRLMKHRYDYVFVGDPHIQPGPDYFHELGEVYAP